MEGDTKIKTGDEGTKMLKMADLMEELRAAEESSTKSNGWTRQNLKPYRRFDKLVGERKYASKYPNQPFRFLDLPAEVRNQIYSLHLSFVYIELSPKADNIEGNRQAVKRHTRFYKYNVIPRLKLLRVNKKINLEAAYIFYSQNQFRFSSSHGHEMLLAFCRTIGKTNTGFLKKISEHAPWDGKYEHPTYYRDRPAHTNVSSWWKFKDVINEMGLHEKGRGAWKFDIMRTLTRSDGGITEYSLVLPDRFILQQSTEFSTTNLDRSLLKKLKSPATRISVIHLRCESSLTEIASDYEVQRAHRRSLRNEVSKKGWSLEEADYDKFGNYALSAESDFWCIGKRDVGIL